jgi:hypothetical protein
MDLVLKRSGGQNVVLRPQARAAWLPAATVDAHYVEVFYQELDEAGALVGSPIPHGRYDPRAEVSIPYNPAAAERDVLVYVMPHAADGTPGYSSLRDAPQFVVPFARETAAAGGIDEAAPGVTKAPTVAKAGAEEFLVFTPAPDAHGATVTDGEIRLRRAGTLALVSTWTIPSGPSHRIPQPAFDVEVSYRWRNQFRGGGSEGWSAWSPDSPGAGAGSAAQPPPAGEANADFIYDEFDSRAGIERTVLEQ